MSLSFKSHFYVCAVCAPLSRSSKTPFAGRQAGRQVGQEVAAAAAGVSTCCRPRGCSREWHSFVTATVGKYHTTSELLTLVEIPSAGCKLLC